MPISWHPCAQTVLGVQFYFCFSSMFAQTKGVKVFARRVRTNQRRQKFSPAFFKRRHGSNAVGRWSRSAEREIPKRRFSFGNFSLCACGVKEKSGQTFFDS